MTARSGRWCCGRVLGALFFAVPAFAAGVEERVGDRIVRFHVSEAARSAAAPFPGYLAPPAALGPAPADFPLSAEFLDAGGRPAARIAVAPGTSLYGTGEVPGPLLRNGRRTVCWNTDAYGWSDGTPSLYQSHPWVLAVRQDGSAFGVLAETTYRCEVDLAEGISFVADGPAFPVLAIARDDPAGVLRALHELIGGVPLPPRWALGYHQCRWSYTPAARVREVAAEFRRRRIPCDVLWLDIDHMDGHRCFTFHPVDFPDAAGLCADLHTQGFRVVAILDPGIKVDPGYSVFESGTRFDVWVKQPDGQPFVGKVWPGACAFPDFTNARTRDWWAGLLTPFLATGIDGIWNDMNEPALFDVDTHTMPLDNRHDADAGLGGPGMHVRYHNIYGMQMARASWEGLLRARPERRPFVLSRANFAGGQRWAAAWTGDNTANWRHLGSSIPMVLNLGLSGQPLAGPDIGGYAGPGNGALFTRWMGIGALLPFARGHTEKGNPAKEPWAFGPDVEHTCRQAIERRYRLLPYLYTLFEEASRTGLPVARPLFFADPADTTLRRVDDAFLLGADVLVVARTTPDGPHTTRLPRGIWRRFDLEVGDEANADLPELYLRGGSIVPVGPVMQHADERPLDPLELLVCLDAEERATGALYEDDGDGFGYRAGRFRRTMFAARLDGDAVTVTTHVESGSLVAPERRVEVRLLLDGRELRGRAAAGTSVRLRRRGSRRRSGRRPRAAARPGGAGTP